MEEGPPLTEVPLLDGTSQLHPPSRGLPSKELSLPQDPAATFRLQDRCRWQ